MNTFNCIQCRIDVKQVKPMVIPHYPNCGSWIHMKEVIESKSKDTFEETIHQLSIEEENMRKLNGFNNGIDTSDGIGGRQISFPKQEESVSYEELKKEYDQFIKILNALIKNTESFYKSIKDKYQ